MDDGREMFPSKSVGSCVVVLDRINVGTEIKVKGRNHEQESFKVKTHKADDSDNDIYLGSSGARWVKTLA